LIIALDAASIPVAELQPPGRIEELPPDRAHVECWLSARQDGATFSPIPRVGYVGGADISGPGTTDDPPAEKANAIAFESLLYFELPFS